MSKKLTQIEVEQRFKDRNLVLLDTYKGNNIKIKTQCYCGNIFYPKPFWIFNNNTRSCGCYWAKIHKDRRINYTGKKFHKLLVIKFDKERILTSKKIKLYWLCICDCGKIKSVCSSDLVSGGVKTCGNCGMLKNGQTVSLIQLDLYSMINKGVLNFKTGKYWIDIAFISNGKKIAVEYDSWKWHSKKIEKDKIRTKWLIDNGWSVLSVKSDYKLPTQLQLKDALNHISESSCNYYEIILPDWGVK